MECLQDGKQKYRSELRGRCRLRKELLRGGITTKLRGEARLYAPTPLERRVRRLTTTKRRSASADFLGERKVKQLTARELIERLEAMINNGDITDDAAVMLQGPGQAAETMGCLCWISPRIPFLSGTPNGVILISE